MGGTYFEFCGSSFGEGLGSRKLSFLDATCTGTVCVKSMYLSYKLVVLLLLSWEWLNTESLVCTRLNGLARISI